MNDITKSFVIGWNLRFSVKSQGTIAREFEVSPQYVSKFKKQFSIERGVSTKLSTILSTKPYQPPKTVHRSPTIPDHEKKPRNPENPMVDINSTINLKKHQLSTSIPNGLDYRILLTAVNNYLKGYKNAYENAKNDPLSETKLKYEMMLKQKGILEEKIK